MGQQDNAADRRLVVSWFFSWYCVFSLSAGYYSDSELEGFTGVLLLLPPGITSIVTITVWCLSTKILILRPRYSTTGRIMFSPGYNTAVDLSLRFHPFRGNRFASRQYTCMTSRLCLHDSFTRGLYQLSLRFGISYLPKICRVRGKRSKGYLVLGQPSKTKYPQVWSVTR